MRRSVLLLVLLAAARAGAQTEPTQTAIDDANRLGHLLFAYDQAAWHGTDAVMLLAQDEGDRYVSTVRGYAVEPDGEGWRVSFGRLAPDASAALVAYEVRLDADFAPTASESFETPVARTGFVRDALRAQAAVDFAGPMAGLPPDLRYNSLTLPGPGETVRVYFIPAQPAVDVFYVGVDVRYTVDPERGTVTDRQTLHPGLDLYDLRSSASMSFASTDAAGVPVETDVFYAISRRDATRGPVPGVHTVLGPDWAFVFDRTGITSWTSTARFRQATGLTGGGR